MLTEKVAMTKNIVNPVDVAVRAINGTDKDLANALGVRPAAVCRWRKKSEIPPRRLAAVCALTNLPPHVLCADFSFIKKDPKAL